MSRYRKHRRKPYDIVPPKHAFDLWKISFVEESTVAWRLQINAADLQVERVFLRSNEEVSAIGAHLPVDLVSDVGRNGDHCRSHSYTQHDGYPGQQFTSLLTPEGL